MPHKMSGLIWIQTVWHYDAILKYYFENANFEEEKKQQTIKKNTRHVKT